MKQIMSKMIKAKVKRMLLRPSFYIALALILISGACSLSINYSQYNLVNLKTVGSLNIFLYSFIADNLVLSIFAPLIAGLPSCADLTDDIKNGIVRQSLIRSKKRVYLYTSFISSWIGGALVYFISFIIWMCISILIDPSPSPRTDFPNIGLLQPIYWKSMNLYIIGYVIITSIIGGFYGLFSQAIGFCFNNRFIGIILPTVIYYFSPLVISLLPSRLYNYIGYFLPCMTFDFLSGSLSTKTTQVLFIVCLSITISIPRYYKWKINDE